MVLFFCASLFEFLKSCFADVFGQNGTDDFQSIIQAR